MATAVVIIFPVHGMCHVLKARAVNCFMHECNPGSQNEPSAVPFPTPMGFSTHSLLVAWHISATLAQQEPTEEAKKEWLIHLLYP